MTQDKSTNNKRIAKNTMLLYVRMLFLMIVSLYTSRVILNALGVVDYGIYTVVGGVVLMFSMLSGSLSAAISRFLTFELGTGDKLLLNRVFSSSLTIQVGIALLIVFLAETIGLWFMNEKMVFPADRLSSANWVFQFSIITFSINLLSVPYNAAIIAHEKMSAFAYISILEAVGKLLIAWCITITLHDRLILYALLITVLSFGIFIVYVLYCKKQFFECSYSLTYDSTLLKRMFSFAGWNFIGASSGILRSSGIDILLNLFLGPSVNAARGVASKVDSVINGFVNNFMTALNPQITKAYANNDKEYMFKLMFQGARLSFYILLFLCVPVIINAHYILTLWLRIVPEHTVLFVQLTLFLAMSECISYPLITAMLATGNIRNYQISVGGLQLMNLPCSYLCLHMGAAPEIVVIVALIISQCCFVMRLYMLNKMIKLPVYFFLKQVYFKVIVVAFFSFLFPFLISIVLTDNFFSFIILLLISFISTILVELYIGCSHDERKFVYVQFYNKLKVLIHL
jgi:O-antigen/teichoic acid export membrane protein